MTAIKLTSNHVRFQLTTWGCNPPGKKVYATIPDLKCAGISAVRFFSGERYAREPEACKREVIAALQRRLDKLTKTFEAFTI